MAKQRIGILTWRDGTRFVEPACFRRMIREGEELGATIFLFSPQDVFTSTRKVRGYTPDSAGKWVGRLYDWPHAVLDRYRYYPMKKHEAYLPFRKEALFDYVNSRFANKWRVHQVLWEDGRLRRWLPETHAFAWDLLEEMLDRHGQVYLKPSNGTGGRSILRIERNANGYLLIGRGKNQAMREQHVPDREALLAYLRDWTAAERVGQEVFVLQQGLRLDLVPKRTVDVRLLIQKNGQGIWKVTGMGARIGGRKSSTSNLHGGGKAVKVGPLLATRFGKAVAKQVIQECSAVARLACDVIESHYGRMVEFGIDIGIDTAGHVWLIEFNPKPGRDIFRELGEKERYRAAVRRPIEYALHLIRMNEIVALPSAGQPAMSSMEND